MKTKKVIVSMILSASLFTPMVATSGGIPVIDGAQITNQVQTWVIEAGRWAKTATQYLNDFNMYKEQLAAQTGVRDIAEFMKAAEKAYKNVKNLKELIADPSKLFEMGKESLPSELKDVYDKFGLFNLCETKREENKKICEGEIINMANVSLQNQKDLEFITDQIKEIQKISDRMSNSKDAKESTDLSNTMSAKIALLQAKKLEMDIIASSARLSKEIAQAKKDQEFIRRSNAPTQPLPPITDEWRK